MKKKDKGGFDPTNTISDILGEEYSLENSEDPDYVFASVFDGFSYMKYNCVRIIYTGEPFAPDDYTIGFDKMNCLDETGHDRFYRYPFCFYNINRIRKYMNGMTYEAADQALKQKLYFCNLSIVMYQPKGNGKRFCRRLRSITVLSPRGAL